MMYEFGIIISLGEGGDFHEVYVEEGPFEGRTFRVYPEHCRRVLPGVITSKRYTRKPKLDEEVVFRLGDGVKDDLQPRWGFKSFWTKSIAAPKSPKESSTNPNLRFVKKIGQICCDRGKPRIGFTGIAA